MLGQVASPQSIPGDDPTAPGDMETGSWKFLLNANGNSQLKLNSRNFFGKWGEKAGEEAGAFSTLALKPP